LAYNKHLFFHVKIFGTKKLHFRAFYEAVKKDAPANDVAEALSLGRLRKKAPGIRRGRLRQGA
jgi:hypothetical protein